MTDVQQIIEAFLDDRDQISDVQMSTLIAAAQKSPQLAAQLKEQLLLSELLGQRYGVDRQNFVAQVEQRIRDYRRGEIEIEEQVEDLRTLAQNELGEWRQRHRRSRAVRYWLTAAVLVLILGGGGAWFALSPRAWQEVVVAAVQGKASFTPFGTTESQDIPQGIRVEPGDKFETSSDQYVTFRYSDGTLVQIGSDSKVQFAVGERTRGKQVWVHQGAVSAQVSPQRDGRAMVFTTPRAQAEVLGTELFLTVQPKETRLDVIEGTVRLTRTLDQGEVMVGDDHYGIVRDDQIVVRKNIWPDNRANLVFLFDLGSQPNFIRDVATGVNRRCMLQPLRNAAEQFDLAMVLNDCAYAAQGVNENLLSECCESDQLTVEAVVRSASLQREGTGRVIAFSSGADCRNFAISQRSDLVIAQIRTTQTDDGPMQPEIEVCQLPDDQAYHIAVTYRPGLVVCYRNGEETGRYAALDGRLDNWTPQQLVLGAEADGSNDWAGALQGVAIYGRFLEAEEVQRNSQNYLKLMRERSE